MKLSEPKESIEWMFTDSRLPAENPQMLGANEFRRCQNGHVNFIPSCLNFERGKRKILYCQECNIEIFRWSAFKMTKQEIMDDEFYQSTRKYDS